MSGCDTIDQLLRELTEDIARDFPECLVPSPNPKDAENGNRETVKLKDPPDVDEILAIDEKLIAPTSHNVSVINSACQDVLREIEHQLLVLLKKNRKEQQIVQGFLQANCKGLNIDNAKKTSLKCAGMPYFKDAHGFLPPRNDDILLKQRKNKLLPVDFIVGSPIWSNADAKALIKAVNNYDITNPASIDWMKISATHMEGKYSASECKSKWFMNLNPSINRARWTAKEMEELKHLSEKYNYQDWDLIASELKTNRTGLQCCIQYMTNSFPTQGKWTDEEDEALQKLVEKFRVKDYIPWAKIAWHFESRSAKQCQERYAYHLGDIKKGTFTEDEDFLIVYLASKLKNFGEVAKFLPNRVATQARSRYEYLVHLSMPEFTKDEDELLTQLMAQYPRDWGKISSHFSNRSNLQCRSRWSYLQKQIKFAEDSESDVEDDEHCDNPPTSNDRVIMSADIDAENYYMLNRSMSPWRKPNLKEPKPTKAYKKVLDYHTNSFKFYFGPKPRISLNPDDQEKLLKKMMVTLKTLSVDHAGPLRGFDIDTLSTDSEFDKEDLIVLNELKHSQVREFDVSKEVIPPNFLTLIGLRSLILSWARIKAQSAAYDEEQQLSSPGTNKIISGDRILCSDAKKLFKSRLKKLFAFPLILSNIAPDNSNVLHKPKQRKAVKPLSKLRRRQHARLMNAAYRAKRKALERKEDTDSEELFEDNDDNEEEDDGGNNNDDEEDDDDELWEPKPRKRKRKRSGPKAKINRSQPSIKRARRKRNEDPVQ